MRFCSEALSTKLSSVCDFLALYLPARTPVVMRVLAGSM